VCACVCLCVCVCVFSHPTHLHTLTPSLTHTHTFSLSLSLARSLSLSQPPHSSSRTNLCSVRCSFSLARTCAHAHCLAHTHKRTRAHSLSHRHTLSQFSLSLFLSAAGLRVSHKWAQCVLLWSWRGWGAFCHANWLDRVSQVFCSVLQCVAVCCNDAKLLDRVS